MIVNKKKIMIMKEYCEEGLDLYDCVCEGFFYDYEKKGKKGKKLGYYKY